MIAQRVERAKDFVTVAAGQAVHRRSGVRQLMVAIVVLGAYKKKIRALYPGPILSQGLARARNVAYAVLTVFVTRTSTGKLVTKTTKFNLALFNFLQS